MDPDFPPPLAPRWCTACATSLAVERQAGHASTRLVTAASQKRIARAPDCSGQPLAPCTSKGHPNTHIDTQQIADWFRCKGSKDTHTEHQEEKKEKKKRTGARARGQRDGHGVVREQERRRRSRGQSIDGWQLILIHVAASTHSSSSRSATAGSPLLSLAANGDKSR